MAESEPGKFFRSAWGWLTGRSSVEKPAQAVNREPITQDEPQEQEKSRVDQRLVSYLQTHEQQHLSYSELDKASEQKLAEKEFALRTAYAAFVDVFPGHVKRRLPSFNELTNFSYPEAGRAQELATRNNDYLKVLDLLKSAVTPLEMPNFGFPQAPDSGETKDGPKDLAMNTLSELAMGRFQTFVINAEMLEEAQRKFDRQSEGRAFVK